MRKNLQSILLAIMSIYITCMKADAADLSRSSQGAQIQKQPLKTSNFLEFSEKLVVATNQVVEKVKSERTFHKNNEDLFTKMWFATIYGIEIERNESGMLEIVGQFGIDDGNQSKKGTPVSDQRVLNILKVVENYVKYRAFLAVNYGHLLQSGFQNYLERLVNTSIDDFLEITINEKIERPIDLLGLENAHSKVFQPRTVFQINQYLMLKRIISIYFHQFMEQHTPKSQLTRLSEAKNNWDNHLKQIDEWQLRSLAVISVRQDAGFYASNQIENEEKNAWGQINRASNVISDYVTQYLRPSFDIKFSIDPKTELKELMDYKDKVLDIFKPAEKLLIDKVREREKTKSSSWVENSSTVNTHESVNKFSNIILDQVSQNDLLTLLSNRLPVQNDNFNEILKNISAILEKAKLDFEKVKKSYNQREQSVIDYFILELKSTIDTLLNKDKSDREKITALENLREAILIEWIKKELGITSHFEKIQSFIHKLQQMGMEENEIQILFDHHPIMKASLEKYEELNKEIEKKVEALVDKSNFNLVLQNTHLSLLN